MDAEGCAHILRGLISYHERMQAVKVMPMGDGKVCQQNELCPERAKQDLYMDAIKFALATVEALGDKV